MVSLNFRSQQGRSSSKALAQLLTEELRQAQVKARRDQRPVAIVFPSQNGSKAISQGFYQLEGYGRAKLRRSASFASENSRAQVMVGVWPVASPEVNGINQGPPPPDAIDLDAWLPNELQKDFCLVFLPSGAVQSNDLPMFGGAYHLAVGSGIEFSGAGTPSGPTSVTAATPNYFAPTEVGEPYTVIVEKTGGLRSVAGLAGSSGGVTIKQAFTPTQTPAPLVSLPSVANRNPAFDQVKVAPELDPALAPPGVDAQVQPDEYLTLTVTATDDDGDELFCLWTADTGSFTSPDETRMEWDEATRTRRSVWTWQPPSTAIAGDPFVLTCRVRDSSGAVATPIVGSVINGVTEEEGKVYFLRVSGGSQHQYTCKPDGSGERRLSTEGVAQLREVHTAPDSSRIVYSARANGTGRYQIETANADGSNVQVLFAEPGRDLTWPRINPQGTHIIFNRAGELWKINADGTNLMQMTTPSWGSNDYVSWSSDGSRIAWIRAQRGVVTMDLDVANNFAPLPATENEVLGNTGTRYHYVEWTPNPVNQRLLINGNVGAEGTQANAFHIDPDNPMDRVDLPPFPNTPGRKALACWSPDGSQFIYGDADKLYVIQANDTTGVTRQQILDGPLDFPVWVQ